MREFSNDLKKIVIKVGSSSVSHENGGVDIERIEELAKEIVNLENKGIKVILVSSGAIATGAVSYTHLLISNYTKKTKREI